MKKNAPLPTFEELAARLKVKLCDRDCMMRALNTHKNGWATYEHIHWYPRIPTRRGIWNFLKLVVEQRFGLFDRREVERIWMRNAEAYELACELGYRFPHEYADMERAKVRAILAGHGDKMAIDPETRRMIDRWAR